MTIYSPHMFHKKNSPIAKGDKQTRQRFSKHRLLPFLHKTIFVHVKLVICSPEIAYRNSDLQYDSSISCLKILIIQKQFLPGKLSDCINHDVRV